MQQGFTHGGTIVTDLSTGTPCIREMRLRVTKGPDEGAEYELGIGTRIVGSHQHADIRIGDPMASRRHFELQLLDDGVRIKDLGSTNGTFVGASKIEQAVLAAGALIRVGDTEMVLEAHDTPTDLGEGQDTFGPLLTRSPRMRKVFGLLERVASTDVTVLLEGETGVGKDVMSRTIHEESPRKNGPFLVFDCGAVSPNLLASELFGHVRGAFTGAVSDRAGIFEAARGGTVFLDEIGELQLELQSSLLRVLENRQVRRVGETKARPIDVRILAATNRSLAKEVEAGRFRQDLLFRLSIVRCEIPPLRDRPEDIPIIAERLLEGFGKKRGALTPADMGRLISYRWPGNVRELRNVLEQSVALSGEKLELYGLDSAVQAERVREEVTLPRAVPSSGPDGDLLLLPWKEAKDRWLEKFEQRYFQTLLDRHGGNVSRAAKAAGIARPYLHKQITRLGLKRHGGEAS